MNKSVDNILSQVYELEGLLLLVENHGQNTNSFVLDLIRKKAQTIAELSHLVEVGTAVAMQSSPDVQDEIIEDRLEQEDEDIQEDVFDEECKVKKPFFKATATFEMLGSDTCCDTDEDDIDIEDIIEDEEVNDDLFDNEDEVEDDAPIENCVKKEFSIGNSFIGFSVSIETPAPETPIEEIVEVEDIIEDDEQEWSIEDRNQEDEFIEETETISNTIIDDYDSIIDPEEEEDTVVVEEEEIEIEEIYEDDEEEIEEEEVEEEEDEILTVEEALSRNLSKNLRQAFTLNDRFRYRRELFGNSDVEMTNTLNLVEAMDSYTEAEDYFYGDMEWDEESLEVVDFMTIIRNHFA